MTNSLVQTYPVEEYENLIIEMVKNNPVCGFSAETGTGKSTKIPQILRKAFNCNIGVAVPTRTSAASLCDRVSYELGTTVGALVGFQTGYDKAFSDETEILYLTEAIEFMKQIHENNDFLEDGILIIDELQEWSINVETLVAWIKKKIRSGWKTKVVLMSATMDVEGISKFFDDAPILKIPGKLFDITEYHEPAEKFEDSICKLASEGHNVLAFVPGKGEIDNTIKNLEKRNLNATLLPLHGNMPLWEQQSVFQSTPNAKVVVATNIAQTSITIPDIDAVVDTGLERHMEKVDGLDTLVVGQISKSDYIQRRGRAGRTKPGIYIWCNDTPISKLAEYPTPDIFTGNIDQVVLRLASIDVDASDVEFFHQPPIEKIKTSQRTLRILGAFDENNQITECGKIMAQLPVSVRYARMIVEGHKNDVLDDMITIAALSEFGGIKIPQVSFEGFSRERKADLLAEFDCFNLVKQRLNDKEKAQERILFGTSSQKNKDEILATMNPFAGIQERNYYRVDELRLKLSDILWNIYNEVSSSHNRNDILKSCAAGLVEYLYVREGNTDWYNCANDTQKRKLDKHSPTVNAKYILGLPRNLAYKGSIGNQTLYLISYPVMVDASILMEVAPHMVHEGIRNEFKYETNEYLTREIKFFGDTEIDALESRLSGHAIKRELLSKWLAKVTVDEDFHDGIVLDKALSKAIDRNYGVFDSIEEAENFYSQRLDEFYPNSVPNLKKCKNFAFLVS